MEIKQLEKGKQYRIKGSSPYFKGKYGNSNPLFRYEGTDIEIWVFLFGGLFSFLISLITVSLQTIKVANTDPVQSLRYE